MVVHEEGFNLNASYSAIDLIEGRGGEIHFNFFTATDTRKQSLSYLRNVIKTEWQKTMLMSNLDSKFSIYVDQIQSFSGMVLSKNKNVLQTNSLFLNRPCPYKSTLLSNSLNVPEGEFPVPYRRPSKNYIHHEGSKSKIAKSEGQAFSISITLEGCPLSAIHEIEYSSSTSKENQRMKDVYEFLGTLEKKCKFFHAVKSKEKGKYFSTQ